MICNFGAWSIVKVEDDDPLPEIVDYGQMLKVKIKEKISEAEVIRQLNTAFLPTSSIPKEDE